MLQRLVLFTDLDGTLLDHETYSFEAASRALQRLRAENVPVVLCTSKTRAEVASVRLVLENNHPFIVENGGGVCIPDGYFPFAIDGATRQGATWVLPMGVSYGDVVRALSRASRSTGIRVRGFADMSTEEVASVTGLSPHEAALARQREFDEPFEVLDADRTPELLAAIARQGYVHTAGGRFHHITGAIGKEAAVRRLVALFERHLGNVLTVGLGDAPNDAAFLNVVDVPILVASPHVAALRALVPRGRVTAAPGPAGWNSAVLQLLDQRA